MRSNSPNEKGTWPLEGKVKNVQVTAMFIDVRNSSGASARPSATAEQEAMYLSKMFRKINEIWVLCNNPTAYDPASVQLRGDGMLIVWNSISRALRREIVRFSLAVHSDLHTYLKDNEFWLPGWSGIGIGMACGPAALASYSRRNEYFGYTLNLASKLQGHARPFGVVMKAEFLNNELDEFRDSLVSKEIFEPLISRDSAHLCFATPDVREDQPWKCIAFPGYAASMGTFAAHLPLHMNGVSVLSHEGIAGKIRSLSLWSKNEIVTEESTHFEILIDDTDVLQDWNQSGVVELLRRASTGSFHAKINSCLQKVCRDLRDFSLDRDIVLIPTRCGLNAIATNRARLQHTPPIASYPDALKLLFGGTKIGLWDNAFSSISILFLCFEHLGLKLENLHTVTPTQLDDLKIEVKSLSATLPSKQIFKVYRQIFNMARDLIAGREVDLILGGGAWMCDPRDPKAQSSIEIIVPEKQGALLWVEAAAINNEAGSGWHRIASWISRVLHSASAQEHLQITYPYPACPVTSEIIGKATTSEAENLILAETKLIFADPDQLRDNICIRKLPEHPNAWRSTWESIKAEFCSIRDD